MTAVEIGPEDHVDELAERAERGSARCPARAARRRAGRRRRRRTGRATRSCAPVARSRSDGVHAVGRGRPARRARRRTAPRRRAAAGGRAAPARCGPAGRTAGSAGLRASTARASVGKPSGQPVRRARSRSVGDTEHSGRTPSSPARTGSSRPQERKISIVRVLTPVARGKIDVPACRSTTSTRAPLRAAVMAVVSPAGPAPTTRMSCVMATTIGEPAPRQLRAATELRAPAAGPGSRNPSWPAGWPRASRPCAGRGRAAAATSALLRPSATSASTSISRLVTPAARNAGGTGVAPRPRRVGAPARRSRSRQVRASWWSPRRSCSARSARSAPTASTCAAQPSASAACRASIRRSRCPPRRVGSRCGPPSA